MDAVQAKPNQIPSTTVRRISELTQRALLLSVGVCLTGNNSARKKSGKADRQQRRREQGAGTDTDKDTDLDVAGRLSVDGAADRVARAEHLFDGASEGAGHRALAHGSGDVDDLVKGDVAVVLDVLHLRTGPSVDGGHTRGRHERVSKELVHRVDDKVVKPAHNKSY